ncbi:ClpP/crotonase-like domain containing protein [Nitzschia inconspicua]|uniref:enoyl-CoA hydratase n=1 Tax=Nitzschia inconspicua TaxID=303405 RepID=A0A9K3PZ24_9STRA|nr:ClpP/crotonase-like domain containing protein [Nitzschia inconspicua]
MLVKIATGRVAAATLRRASTRALAVELSSTTSTFSSNFAPKTSLSLSTARFQSTAAVQQQQEEPTAATESKAPFVSTPERQYEHFTNVEVTPEGVAIIRFDCPGKKVNAISFALAKEAEQLWKKEVENNPNVKAVVFSSAKPGMFIAGADIFDIKRIEDKSELVGLIEEGLHFFQNMRQKGVPLVCAIDGPCLGGGLEWTMWCDYRVASDSPKTKLGLPEVKLGLLPGFGGTQNLHELVGIQNAMDMMLTGKDVRPDKAKKMGLVDLVVAPQSVESAAIASAVDLINGKIKLKKKPKSLMNRLIEDNPLGRRMMWNQVKKMVDKNTNGNYPAPYAIMQCVQHGLDSPKTKFQNEREQFAKLAATPESEALIGIFDGMTQMKKNPFTGTGNPVSTVAVMGAGLMGAGIGQVTAEKGMTVLLKDRNDEAIERGESYMRGNWDKKLKRKRMTQFQHNINTSNVVGLTDDSPTWKEHFAKADMVIEAVFENLDLKKKIVADIESVTPEHCVFATNTSAIPIASIAEGAKRPENIIGMHYFSPVPSMPLLEIIPHDGTSESTKATAFDVGTKQGKTVITVKDVPGFYVNRCLGPFLVEVSAVVRDGVPLETLDKAIKKFGMPVGPVTLADEVGVDVVSHVASFLSDADLGVRMEGGDISLMQNMIGKGWLGKKAGQGFYTYDKKKKGKSVSPEVKAYLKDFVQNDLKLDEKEIQDRVISRFVNEAAKCLEDEIIDNPVVGDIGLVFGTGFAPFRGGPFRYLDQMGVSTYVDRMNFFADKYGPQFEPCQLLKDYAATNKKFHSK